MAKRGQQPRFWSAFQATYNERGNNLVVLTGAVNDLHWSISTRRFVSLGESLLAKLSESFLVVKMDMANGLTFPDEAIQDEVVRVFESRGGPRKKPLTKNELQLLPGMIERNRHSPLPNLVLLQALTDAFRRVREAKPVKPVRPLCVIIEYAGALFPEGAIGQLPELDRQRLVTCLSWIASPLFAESPDLVVLVHPVRSELNRNFFELPNMTHIEIPLPDLAERARLVDSFLDALDSSDRRGVSFEGGKKRFSRETAGLTLAQVKDLLEVAHRGQKAVTRAQIVATVNSVLEAKLGGIVRIKEPSHTPDDIIGYEQNKRILRELFERCEDPETAIAAIIVSGPNGGGKTFQIEAFAHESGRVVIELAGLRGSYYGETDKFFELLRWHIATLGKVLIFVDEAHTAFGSVHASGTHETEKRLAGNIIKMMSDKTLFGKVVWVLMTSRPDELDPDVKSRAPVQIPIFDLEGDERVGFVRALFERKGVPLPADEQEQVLLDTRSYSARDLDHLAREVLAQRRKHPDRTIVEVLAGYQASNAIVAERRLQSLIAALHCTYPDLLPAALREAGEEAIRAQVMELHRMLGY